MSNEALKSQNLHLIITLGRCIFLVALRVFKFRFYIIFVIIKRSQYLVISGAMIILQTSCFFRQSKSYYFYRRQKVDHFLIFLRFSGISIVQTLTLFIQPLFSIFSYVFIISLVINILKCANVEF